MIRDLALAVTGVALVLLLGSIRFLTLTQDTIAVLVRLTTVFGLLALALWMSGADPAGLGIVITIVLVGVLAITWAVRQERVVVPKDISSLEDRP